ncbi:MAG: methyltransferase domain-containing protein [Bacteroidota bacterium]
MKEQWDERYADDAYIYGTDPNNWLAGKLAVMTPGIILFPAEGEGRNAVYAAEMGWEVFAFDQSEEGKKKAERLSALKGVTINYDIADLTGYNPEKKRFDVIALIFVHMPVEIRKSVHLRITELLKPGGYIILEAFTKQQLNNTSGGPRTEMLLYEKDFIRNDFSGLDFLEFAETLTYLNEGPLHQGEAHVIRLLARKPMK